MVSMFLLLVVLICKLKGRVLKTTKTKKQKENGIWREKTGLNGRELLKTGALRCIAPFFILREIKLRKNQIFG